MTKAKGTSITCGMFSNRRIWSERVEPGKTSPPIAMPKTNTSAMFALVEITKSWITLQKKTKAINLDHKYTGTFIYSISDPGNCAVKFIWHATLWSSNQTLKLNNECNIKVKAYTRLQFNCGILATSWQWWCLRRTFS